MCRMVDASGEQMNHIGEKSNWPRNAYGAPRTTRKDGGRGKDGGGCPGRRGSMWRHARLSRTLAFAPIAGLRGLSMQHDNGGGLGVGIAGGEVYRRLSLPVLLLCLLFHLAYPPKSITQ